MSRPRQPGQRPFDVVLYGATGFVGRQTAHYFADHAQGVRWAIAGRSAPRLEALRADLGAASPAIVVADADDAAALDTLAAQTRVVLSTAGPFARYGSELVAACVRQATHYVDITGETPWVRRMIDRHHEDAAARGIRIVPGCGFDSVPSDLGAWLVARALQQRHGERCAAREGLLLDPRRAQRWHRGIVDQRTRPGRRGRPRRPVPAQSARHRAGRRRCPPRSRRARCTMPISTPGWRRS